MGVGGDMGGGGGEYGTRGADEGGGDCAPGDTGTMLYNSASALYASEGDDDARRRCSAHRRGRDNGSGGDGGPSSSSVAPGSSANSWRAVGRRCC